MESLKSGMLMCNVQKYYIKCLIYQLLNDRNKSCFCHIFFFKFNVLYIKASIRVSAQFRVIRFKLKCFRQIYFNVSLNEDLIWLERNFYAKFMKI